MSDPLDQARELLGVVPEVDKRGLRRAYMRAVKRHPPERDAGGFQAVRQAYDLLLPWVSEQARSQPDPREVLLQALDQRSRPTQNTRAEEPPPAEPPPEETQPEDMPEEPDWETETLEEFDAWLDHGPEDAWEAVSLAQHRRHAWADLEATLLVALARHHDRPDRLVPTAFVSRLLGLACDAPLVHTRRVWAALDAWIRGSRLLWVRGVPSADWASVVDLFELQTTLPESLFRHLAAALLTGEWGPARSEMQTITVNEPAMGTRLWQVLDTQAPTLRAGLRGDERGALDEHDEPETASPLGNPWLLIGIAIVLLNVLGKVIKALVGP